jgi:hypothetical protein
MKYIKLRNVICTHIFEKIRQSIFNGLRKSHATIDRVKFGYLTVLVQDPKMSDKMYNKRHVTEIFRVVSV